MSETNRHKRQYLKYKKKYLLTKKSLQSGAGDDKSDENTTINLVKGQYTITTPNEQEAIRNARTVTFTDTVMRIDAELVKGIKNDMFNGYSTLAAMVDKRRTTYTFILPSSLKHIEKNAFDFSNEYSFNEYVIDFKKATVLETIGEKAFASCISQNIIQFPKSLTRIDNGAFMKMSSHGVDFTHATSLIEIGDYAFMSCTGLVSNTDGNDCILSLPSSIKTIKQYAFAFTNIKTMAIESTDLSIGFGRF